MLMTGASGRHVHSSVLSWGLAQDYRALEVLPSAGRVSAICPWWRKEDVYPAKLQTFNPGDFCTGYGELTSIFPRFSSILMDVCGHQQVGLLNTAPTLPPAVRRYIF